MGTTAEKFDFAFGTKDLLKTEINKINNVLTDESTFRSYPQELFNGYLDILNNGTDTLWSNLEKVSASGEETTLENVETAPIKMVLNGNTSQDGTPTPDTPVEVKVVKGENVVSVSGKNLFDEETELGRLQSSSSSPDFGGEVASTTQLRAKDYIQVKPNTTYFCYFGSTVSGAQVFVFAYDENYNAITSYGYKTFTNTTITTPEGAKYIRFYMNAQYGTTYNNDICIAEGTSTSYTPYSKTDYPINLGDIELCKINTYKDYFHKDSGKWYVHKEIGKKVFDGTEFWRTVPTNTTDVYRMLTTSLKGSILAPATSSTQFLAFCSRFKPIIADDTYKKNEGISCARDENVHIYMEDYNTSTSVTDFKTWLSNNNVTLYYVLATPTEEEITNTTLIEQLEAISKAKSVKDKTYITQTNDELPFILDVEAIKEYSVE